MDLSISRSPSTTFMLATQATYAIYWCITAFTPSPRPIHGELKVCVLGTDAIMYVNGKLYSRPPPLQPTSIHSTYWPTHCSYRTDGNGRSTGLPCTFYGLSRQMTDKSIKVSSGSSRTAADRRYARYACERRVSSVCSRSAACVQNVTVNGVAVPL